MTTSSMPASSICVTERLVELGVGGDDDLAGERVDDVLERDAAEDAVAEGLDDLAGLLELGDADAVERAAVELGDDGVLRDVDETTREVTGVRRLERGVRETLTRAVRRDEVLRARVRPSRKFAVIGRLDDLARGLGHQAAHARRAAGSAGSSRARRSRP